MADSDPYVEWDDPDLNKPARNVVRKRFGSGETSKSVSRAFQRALREYSQEKQRRHRGARSVARFARTFCSVVAALILGVYGAIGLVAAITQADDLGVGVSALAYVAFLCYLGFAFVAYALIHGFFTMVLGVTE